MFYEIDFIKVFIPKLANLANNIVINFVENKYQYLKQNGVMLCRNDFSSAYPDFNLNIYYIFNDDLKNYTELQLRYHWHIKGHIEKQISNLNTFFELYDKYDNEFFYKINKELINKYYEDNYIYYFDINKNKLNKELVNIKTFHTFIKTNKNFIKSIYDFFITNPDINIEVIGLFNKDLFRTHVSKRTMKDNEIKEIIYFYLEEIEKENRETILNKEDFYNKYDKFDLDIFKKFNKKYEKVEEIICITDYHSNNLIGSLNDFLEKHIDFDLDNFKETVLDKNLSIIDNLVKFHLDKNYRSELEEVIKVEEKVDTNFSVEKVDTNFSVEKVDTNFDWEFYLDIYPDLEQNGIKTKEMAYNHWKKFGKKEGRKGCFDMITKKYNLQSNTTTLKNYILLVGLKDINCSISENLLILKNTFENKNIPVKIFDKSEYNNIYQNSRETIICLQPFELEEIDFSKFKTKPSIFWVWEFKSLPFIFKKYESYIKKIYVPSEFCKNIFNDNFSTPVEKIEYKSLIHNYIGLLDKYKLKNEKIFHIINKNKTFLKFGFCFDLNSSLIRKNVLNLVKAFELLENESNKILILKTRKIRNKRNISQIETQLWKEIKEIINKCENIYLIEEELEIMELYKFYTYLDFYISPHCGEGFGLTIYDNMILGNKIISPFYSGETDYLKRDKIIELEFEDTKIEGLDQHPIYGQMNDFYACHLDFLQIYKYVIKIKEIKLKSETIDIYIILKDNEYYVSYILPDIIKELENNFNCKWYIYENNSADNTKNLLKLLFENLNSKMLLEDEDFDYNLFNKENCKYIEEKINDKNNNYMKIGYRCEKIALAREKCKKLCSKSKSKWSLLLDTDIILRYKQTILPLIEARNNLPNGKMFCSYTTTIVSYPEYKTNDLENIIIYEDNRYIFDYYYDTFAYNWGEYLWYTNFKDIIEKAFGDQEYLKVKSAFGGCVLIESNTLHKSTWNTICDEEMKSYNGYKIYGALEHNNLCKDVKKYGDIYIVKESKGIWLTEQLIKDEKLLKLCIEKIFYTDKKILGINTKSEYIDFFLGSCDGLSTVANSFQTFTKYISNNSFQNKLVNEKLETSKQTLILCEPPKAERFFDINHKNYILTMFESNKLPLNWVVLLNKYEGIFVPLNNIKRLFIESGVKSNIYVTNLIVSKYTRKKTFWNNNSTFVVGHIGNWKDRKNLDKLIKSVYNLKQKGLDIILKLHFAFWYNDKYKNNFFQLFNIYKNVIEFTENPMNEDEKNNWFSSLDLYVCCSSSEGFSLGPREAIKTNIPICITDISTHNDIIKMSNKIIISNKFSNAEYEGNAGIIPIINIEDIQNSIKNCYLNYNNCIINANHAYNWASNKWTKEKFEYIIQNNIKINLFKKKKHNNNVLFFFPHCFYPSRCGVHKLAYNILKELIDYGYFITILSYENIEDEFVNYIWGNDNINFFVSKNINVELMNIDWSQEKIKEFIEPLININDIIRIHYSPENWKLNTLFDDEKLFSKKTLILDQSDDIKLNIKLNEMIKNKDNYLDISYYYNYIHNYYKNIDSNMDYISKYAYLFDHIICLNDNEAHFFERCVTKNTLVNKFNCAQITKSIQHTDRIKIIFVASNNIFNIQAFHVLEEKIMPLLDEDIEIEIYGGLKSKVETNNNKLKLMGFVDNIDDVYKNTLFSICPIIAGTGQKIKILESLSYNIPVVTFQINNIDILEQQTNCFIAENEQEFADYINYIHKHPEIVMNIDCNKLPLELYEKSKDELYNIFL